MKFLEDTFDRYENRYFVLIDAYFTTDKQKTIFQKAIGIKNRNGDIIKIIPFYSHTI